jgi:ATP-dependent helicase/nuclease subunit A
LLPPLTVYKSSAGSGKTFTLVKEYLRLCLEDPDRFRKVVAITFTNAAAAEMKERILQKLKDLSTGADKEFEELLIADGISERAIANAPVLLKKILYDYGHFNIGTIDSFFHRILRAFSKELGLPVGFDIFLDTDDALDYTVDTLLHRSHTQAEVHKVLTAFVQEKIENGKSWQVREDLLQMARELLKDNAMLRGEATVEDIVAFAGELRKTIRQFEDKMDAIGRQALDQLSGLGFSVDHFSNKSAGPTGYFLKIQRNRKAYEPSARLQEALDNPKKWLTADALKSAEGRLLEEAVQVCLHPAAQNAVDLYYIEFPTYIAAREVGKSIYTFAVYEELNKVLDEYRTDNEVVLISDFTKILARHILHEDIGFIYSKLGARYEHYLIDEFQDTGTLQWFGLKPLIENAVSSGSACLVVGDAKQAIYRWRGGEVELIEQGITKRDFADYCRELQLSKNFRSREEVIRFNNDFFERAGNLFENEQGEHHTLQKIYGTASQSPGSPKPGGYIEVNFLFKEGNRKDIFMAKSEEILLKQMTDSLASGYAYGDIAILVRAASDAASVARLCVTNNIPFITQDSLSIDHSPAIRLLFSLLQWLDDPVNELAKAEVSFLCLTYFRNTGDEPIFLKEIAFGSQDSSTALPAGFSELFSSLANLPLYELIEECIRLFGLNTQPDAYLQRFQDLVLEFTLTKGYGIRAFLDWWKEGKYSVVVPEGSDAVRILTIHKSKGLEYPVVMIPYANWDFKTGKNDLIWIESEIAPFNRFPTLPVPFSEKLANSIFSQAYKDEMAAIAVDNLNLLYVAYTRAKDRLYINTQAYKEPKEGIKNVAALISAVLLKENQYDSELQLPFGEPLPNKSARLSSKQDQVHLTEYISTDWRSKVQFASAE